jgi:hypothetical protein
VSPAALTIDSFLPFDARTQKNDYERRAFALLASLAGQSHAWTTSAQQLPATYPSVRALSGELKGWKTTSKRAWVREKGELGDLLSAIRMKLRTYGMADWEPDEGCRLEVVEREWRALGEAEEAYSRIIGQRLKGSVFLIDGLWVERS